MKSPTRFIAIVLLCLTYCQSQAQAFEKNNILLSLGLGGVSEVTGSSSDGAFAPPSHVSFAPLRPQFMIKAEFGVHKYWGLGFIASTDGRMNMSYPYSPGRYSELNTQFGLLVNYHIYQLIADKLHNPLKMHADKIDIYTGFTIGATMNIEQIQGVPNQQPFFAPFMGLHTGIRYYVTPRLSIYGEFGIGQSHFNAGITYKLSYPQKKSAVKKF